MIELFKCIYLGKESKTPLYIQLYDRLKSLIAGGTLPPDFRLPSVRQFARILQVNQITVVSAIRRLENEGYLYTKPGSGTYVANFSPPAPGLTGTGGNLISDEIYLQDDIALISSTPQIKIDENTINFASATPAPDLFPVEDFKMALNDVLERDRGNAFSYHESQGYHPIRESIADILRAKGIRCVPDDIQVISGAQQGIDIVSKALLKQGGCVVAESPTYTGAIAVFKSREARVADIEIKKDGIDLGVFEYMLKKYRPAIFYTIPSFHNPTGYSCPNEKRLEILKLAEKYGTYIIEDDYVSDLDFTGKNYIPLKAMDKNGMVIYLKSFSKIFMPGLRLGFIIMPAGQQENILKAKHTTDISTSSLIQRAIDLYIRKGYWDKHFKFMFEIYKERYFEITKSLDENLPASISYFKPGGGLNIWLNLPWGLAVNSLVKRAAADNLAFAPGRIFYGGSCLQGANNIRLSFASVYTGQINPGIKKLCGILKSMQQGHGPYKNVPIL